MKLQNVALFGAASARTKAYLQVLGQKGVLLGKVYLMCKRPQDLIREARTYQPKIDDDSRYFQLDEPVIYTLEKYGVPYLFLNSADINDEISMNCLREAKETYIIYSGIGGQILKPYLFELGKRFIHVHAGMLPQYRGSTTVYYSMLKENACGASAIFLSLGIDEGEVIARESFTIPPAGIDIDYLYEPYTRACVLAKVLIDYAHNGVFQSVKQKQEETNTYFVIHPVLKHIAILQQEKVEKDDFSIQSKNA